MLVGLAPLAEMAIAELLVMIFAGVVLIFIAAFLALVLRSRIAAVVGVAIWAMLTL